MSSKVLAMYSSKLGLCRHAAVDGAMCSKVLLQAGSMPPMRHMRRPAHSSSTQKQQHRVSRSRTRLETPRCMKAAWPRCSRQGQPPHEASELKRARRASCLALPPGAPPAPRRARALRGVDAVAQGCPVGANFCVSTVFRVIELLAKVFEERAQHLRP